ncbi:uncharacterized protein LOC144301133 [Canis aureus]
MLPSLRDIYLLQAPTMKETSKLAACSPGRMNVWKLAFDFFLLATDLRETAWTVWILTLTSGMLSEKRQIWRFLYQQDCILYTRHSGDLAATKTTMTTTLVRDQTARN